MDSIQAFAGVPQAEQPAEETSLINGRYRTIRTLGRGGMGAVYLAADMAQGSRLVALKRVRKDRLDVRGLSLLRNEFLALGSLRHPHLVQAYEFGTDHASDDLFFTSEYVNGVHWLKGVQGLDLSQREDLRVFADLLAQVLRGLEFIHCHGMVHGDVKPENILVTQVEAGTGAVDRQVKIIDFGLAKKEKALGGKKILGTPLYVAPETIMGSTVDRRTDLYSLGVVLYHLTTGFPPFRAESNLEILKSHLEKEPLPPHEAASDLPRGLSDIILRLMAKKPEDRFQGALEVIAALNHACGLDLPLETKATAASYLEAPVITGRDAELSRLRGILRQVLQRTRPAPASDDADGLASERTEEEVDREAVHVKVPAGHLLLIRGEKGVGKNRMLEELRSVAQVEGADCFAVGPSVSTGGVQRIDNLTREVEALVALKERGQSFDYLHAAFGLVQRLQATPQAELRDYEGQVDDVARQILRVTQDLPVLLTIRDLQEASEPVLCLLRCLVRHLAEGRGPGSQLLIVASACESAELREGSCHTFLTSPLYRSSSEEVVLKRLAGPEVERFIRLAFSSFDVTEAFAQRVLEESDGNPEILADILRFLLDRSRIQRTTRGWELSPDYEDEDIPGKVRQELKRRIATLPPDVLRLGMAFACLGEPASPEMAARLTELPSRMAARLAQRLIADRLMHPVGPDGAGREHGFVHSSTRTILYGMIPQAELPALHERAGAALEEHPLAKERLQGIAHHYLLSSNKEKSIRFGLEAARGLAGELQPRPAIEMYQRVLSLVEEGDAGLQTTVRREMASLRFQTGDYRGALALLAGLQGASAAKSRGLDATPAYLEAARAHARLGEFQEASQLLNRSMRLGQGPGSMAELSPILRVLAEINYYRGNFVESLRSCTRLCASLEKANDVKLLPHVYMLLAESYAQLNDMANAAGYCQLALRLIESQHDTQHVAWGLFCRGKHFQYKRQYPKAVRQLQLSLILHRKAGQEGWQAECLREMGALQLALGAPVEAQEALEEAAILYNRCGDALGGVTTLCLLAEASRQLGDHDACFEATAEALRRMEPLEKRSLTLATQVTLGLSALDKAELDKAERYLREAELSCLHGLQGGHNEAALSAAFCELHYQRGEVEKAWVDLQRGVRIAREAQDPTVLARLLAQEGYLLCQVGRTGEARRIVVHLLEIGKRHDLPQAEGWGKLIEGLILMDEGKLDAAEQVFSSAGDAMSAHGNARDLACLYLEHGLLALRRCCHEQAYLSLEEGMHIAERLQIPRLICRYQFAMGLLEAALPHGQAERAEELLLAAEKIALEVPYPEILWQVRYRLGMLKARLGKGSDASRWFRLALTGYRGVIEQLSARSAQAYRRVTEAEELEELSEQAMAAPVVMQE